MNVHTSTNFTNKENPSVKQIFLLTLVFFLKAPQLHAQESAEPIEASNSRDWHFAGAISEYGNSKLGLPMMSSASGPSLSHDVTSAASFALEAVYSGEYSWGFSFGLAFDSKRQIENANDINSDFKGADGNSEISTSSIYVNRIYRWQNLYLPFGVNLARVTINKPSIALQQVTNFPGLQASLGYLLGRVFAIEAGLRLIGIQASFNAGPTSATRTGFLADQFVSAKLYF
jgi:hypothetical protein